MNMYFQIIHFRNAFWSGRANKVIIRVHEGILNNKEFKISTDLLIDLILGQDIPLNIDKVKQLGASKTSRQTCDSIFLNQIFTKTR